MAANLCHDDPDLAHLCHRDGSSRHQEISAFFEGSGKEVGRERGCGAAFPGGGDLGLQGQCMENSATGVGSTDAKPGGITLF